MDEVTENNKTRLTFSDIDLARQLFGEHNSNLQRIADAIDVSINARGNIVFIQEIVLQQALQKIYSNNFTAC